MDREAWLAERRKGIGGSDAAAAIGMDPWKDQLTLWADKVGLVEPPDLSGNEAVESGIELERAIGEWYARKFGRTVVFPEPFTIERHPVHTFMAATIDAWEIRDDGTKAVIQIKNTGQPAQMWEDQVPANYETQLLHEMVVTGCTHGTLVALHRGQALRAYDRTLDQDAADRLIQLEAEFWRMVETETAPPAGPHSADTVKALYPRATLEDVVPLVPDADDLDAELEQVKANIASLSERKDAIESQIKLWIGEHAGGVTPQGIRFSWKGSEVSYKPQEARKVYVRRFTRSAK